MSFLTVILKNLARRRGRSAWTAFGVAIAVAAVVTLRGVAGGLERSFLELYATRGADLVVQRAGGALQLSSGIDQQLIGRIRRLPGVRQVVESLLDLVAFERFDLFGVIVNGWPDHCPVLDAVKIVEGHRFQPGQRRCVMLGKVLAANLSKHAGDRIDLYGQPLEVVGVFESFNVYENGAVFVPLAELQTLINRPHRVTGCIVQAEQKGDEATITDLQRRIEALDPTVSATPTAEFVRNISQLRVTRAAANVTSTIALFMGLLGVVGTMLASVYERAREIGVLRAIGWRRQRVARMVLGEATVLTLAGAALGAAGGILLLKLLAVLPQTAAVVDGHLPAPLVIEAMALSLIVGLAGAVYPALWAAARHPVEAIRHT